MDRSHLFENDRFVLKRPRKNEKRNGRFLKTIVLENFVVSLSKVGRS